MTKRRYRSTVFAEWVPQALGIFVLVSLVFFEANALIAYHVSPSILFGAIVLNAIIVFGIVRWSQLRHTKELEIPVK